MQNKEQWNTTWSTNQVNNPKNKLDYQVLELFPTPVYTTAMPEKLSNIIPFLDAQTPNSGSDEANYGERSDNSYILNEPECVEVKKFVLQHVKEFAENTLLYDYNTWEISQSWVSRKQPGQHHMMHGVPPNKTNRTRKALGVNALTKGTLGDQKTISEIIFGRYAK